MTEPMRDLRAPDIPNTVLTSYLSGQQDGQQWALIDNLQAEEARQVAILAIKLLVAANKCIAFSWVALDGMTERGRRMVAREAALPLLQEYLEALGERVGEMP